MVCVWMGCFFFGGCVCLCENEFILYYLVIKCICVFVCMGGCGILFRSQWEVFSFVVGYKYYVNGIQCVILVFFVLFCGFDSKDFICVVFFLFFFVKCYIRIYFGIFVIFGFLRVRGQCVEVGRVRSQVVLGGVRCLFLCVRRILLLLKERGVWKESWMKVVFWCYFYFFRESSGTLGCFYGDQMVFYG